MLQLVRWNSITVQLFCSSDLFGLGLKRMNLQTVDSEGFIKLFNIKRKRELVKYCKNLTIYQSDFVSFISLCKSGMGDYNYKSSFRDKVPNHLILTDDDHKALTSNGVGPLNKKTKKTIKKMFQYFIERCYSVAHLFYSDSLKYWYLFYFDNRDLSDIKTHWVKGHHIHLINDLWFENIKADEAWKQYLSGNLRVSTKIHIRYSIERHKKPSN